MSDNKEPNKQTANEAAAAAAAAAAEKQAQEDAAKVVKGQDDLAKIAKAVPPTATLSEKAGIKLGDKVLLCAVYGRMVHPEPPFQEFDTGEITKVTFDWWHKIQFDAGKLRLDE